MLRVLRIRDYRLLAAGQLASSLGDWLLLVAAPFHVLRLTGSALATSAAVAAEYVPALLLGPVAGVLADRWDRRRTMLACDLGRAAAVAAMLLVRGSGTVWILYAALVGEASLGRFFGPARSALVPAVVGRGEGLPAAKSLAALIGGTVRLVGGPLGGALYAAAGFGVVVGADVASYLLSAAAIMALRYRAPKQPAATGPAAHGGPGPDRGRGRRHGSERLASLHRLAPFLRLAPPLHITPPLRRVATELSAGLHHIRHERGIPTLITTASIFFCGNAMLTAILVPYVGTVLHADAHLMGLLFSALGVGYLAGAPVSRLAARHGERLVLSTGLTTLAAVLAAAFTVHDALAALVLFTLIGPPAVCVLVTVDTCLTRATPDHLLGRVAAVYATAEAAATLVGMTAGGALAQGAGIGTAADVGCAVVAGSAAVALLLPARRSEGRNAVAAEQSAWAGSGHGVG